MKRSRAQGHVVVIAVGAAMGARLLACNALLGNDEPEYVPGAADGGEEGSATDALVATDGAPPMKDGSVGPTDAGGRDVMVFDATACEAGYECVLIDDLPGPITALSGSPDDDALYWATKPGVAGANWSIDRFDLVTYAPPTQVPGVDGTSIDYLAATKAGVAAASASPPGRLTLYVGPNSGTLGVRDGGVTAMKYVARTAFRYLLWADNGGAWRCGSGVTSECGITDTPQAVDPSKKIVGFDAFDDTPVWVTSDGKLLRSGSVLVDSRNGGVGTVVAGGRGDVGLDAGDVFWGGKTAADGGFVRNAGSGAPGLLPATTPPSSMVASAVNVYWTEKTGPTAFVIYTGFRGATNSFSLLDDAPQADVAQLVLAAEKLYWTRRAATGPARWQLVRYQAP